MKNKLDIDATSFFRSGYGKLSWSLVGAGTPHEQQASEIDTVDTENIHDAIQAHIDRITSALPHGTRLIDYEITLNFDHTVSDEKKDQFTNVFNEFNTRDEST